MDTPYAIEMLHITKRFPGIVANDDITLQLRKGEIHALLGENGSGKTTLMNMLAGIYFPDEGEILVNGQSVTIASPKDAFDCGIGMIHQHFKLVDVFTAAENIVLGLDGQQRLDLKAASAKIKEICEKYGFVIDPSKKVYNMSVSEKQTVEIVKVLYRGADILILDEPTAVLTPQETEKLFTVLRNMKADGKAIVIITHKLHEVMALSDKVAVLRKGKYIGTVKTSETDPQALTDMMVGHSVTLNIDRPKYDAPVPRLTLKGITCYDGEGVKRLDNVSFTALGGEILGIAGIAGCGQKELCEAIAGLRPIEGGQMIHKGENIVGLSPKAILDKGISMSFIPEDRLGMGLAPSLSITDNMLLKTYSDGRGIFVDRKRGRAEAEHVIQELEVVTPSTDFPVRRMSGGNVQKVLVGREIASAPTVLLTAYAVRGLDINASYTIYDLINEQKKSGVGILFVGEDLDVMMALCDKIMVLCHGRVMGVVHAHKVTKEELGLMMTGALDLTNKYEDKPAGIARDTNISAQELQELEQQESGSQEGED